MPTAVRTKRRRSARGNWLVVTMIANKIDFCRWVETWAGVQQSKRHAQDHVDRCREFYKGTGRVFVLDIERMLDFAITEGANEISDLHRLFGLESGDTKDVLALTPHRPLFGNRNPKKAGTHWLVFINSSPHPSNVPG